MFAMNLKKQYPHKKALFIALASLLLLIAGSVIYFVFFTDRNPTANYFPQYPQSISSDSDNSADNSDSSIKNPAVSQTDQTSEDIPISLSGTVEIINLNQKNGYVNVLATIANFSATKCVYIFEGDGARPIAREQTGGCSGISIPEVEFEKIGTYTLNVTVYSDTDKITASKDVDIR